MSEEVKIWTSAPILVPIDEIRPNPKNRNTHPEAQINRLAEIYAHNGMRTALVVSNQSGILVSGHGRLMAARRCGMTHVPVDFQDFDSPEHEYQHSIADNAISLWAELDLSGIHSDLPEVGPFNLDMLGIEGFQLLPPAPPPGDADAAPPVPVVPRSRPGDLFLLGKHRLLCGDSMSIDAVERLMDGKKADMVFTDPPYGVSYQSNQRTKSKKFDVIENDDTLLTEWIGILPVVSSGWVFIWTTWKVLPQWWAITEPLGRMTNMVVWDKGGGGIGEDVLAES
jgi:hypothetical protein